MPNITVTNLTAYPIYLTDLYVTVQSRKSVTTYRPEADLTGMVNLQQAKADGKISVTLAFSAEEVDAAFGYPIDDTSPVLAQTDWYLDPANTSGSANDANDGKTASTPLLTFNTLRTRLSILSYLPSPPCTAVHIHWLSSQSDNSDPVDLAFLTHNVSISMDGVLIQKDTGTFGSVTNINRPDFVLTTGAANGKSSNYWTQYLGFLVHDTTQDVWFFVDHDMGSATAQFTCPYTGTFDLFNDTLAPGTISAGDNFIVYDLPKVYSSHLSPHVGGDDLLNTTFQITQLRFAANGPNFALGPRIQLFGETYGIFQRLIFDAFSTVVGEVWEQTLVNNCYFSGGAFLRECYVLGGGTNRPTDIADNTTLDGDIIVHGAPEMAGGINFGTVCCYDERGPSFNFIDVPINHVAQPATGQLTIGIATYGEASLYGSATLRVRPSGRVIVETSATTNIQLTGSILIDGESTGTKVGVDGVSRSGIAINVANIDSTILGNTGMQGSGGSGSGIFWFIPQFQSDPRSASTWYIDPSAGSDNNSGSVTNPIQTLAEFNRRVQTDGVWQITKDVDVFFVSYPPSSDIFRLVIQFNGPHTVTFNAPSLTANSSGTFTAVTTRNNATNTPFEVADGTVTTSSDVMRRIRVTSGARSGAQAWVAKSTGTGLRRTSEWIIWDPVALFPTAVVPVVGDPYVIESSATPLTVSHIIIERSSGYGVNYAGAQLVFNNIDFVPPTTNSTVIFENRGGLLTFQNCLFYNGEWQVRTVGRSGDNDASATTLANCCLGNVGINNFLVTDGSVIENFVFAGLGFGQLSAEGAGGIGIDFNYLAQAVNSFPNVAATHGGQLSIGSMGIMDWHGIGGGLVLENAMASITSEATNPGHAPSLWGTSAVSGTVGVSVNADCSFRYDNGALITVTGLSGDFQLAGASQARAWDDTAGNYTANIACTWANLIGGSLKDNAHNLMQNAHIYKNTAGAQP